MSDLSEQAQVTLNSVTILVTNSEPEVVQDIIEEEDSE